MSSFWAMTKANLKMTVRNRTALFWNLVFPALFIVIFGSVFGNDQIDITVSVTGDESAYQAEVSQVFIDSDAFGLRSGGTIEGELETLEEGDTDIVLVFGTAASAGALPPVDLYYDETSGPTGEIAISAVNQVLLGVAQGEDAAPIEAIAVTGQDISFMDFFLPGILAMAIMNSGIIGLSTAFVTYRERGILRRIKVTPFRLSSFVGSRIVSQLIVAVPQALILTFIAWLFFDLTLRGNPLMILFLIFLGSLAFLAVGFAVSSVARNVESAASYANLIAFPMLFLSGVFFDLDSAPTWLQPITKILPLNYLVDALRETMTQGKGSRISGSISWFWL